MFPITDPSRAADIRMRRRRAAWLLTGILLVPFLLFSGGHGRSAMSPHRSVTDDLDIDLSSLSIRSGTVPGTQIESVLRRIPILRRLDWMVQGAPLPAGRRDAAAISAVGSSLTVAVACADSIMLVPQTDLSDRVFVSTGNGTPAAGTGLTLTGGPRLTLGGSCGQGGSRLVIQAPAGMPLTVVQAGDGEMRLGEFTGPVRLVQNGRGDAAIDASGPLDVAKSGSGDLSVGRLNGSLHLNQAGSGDVTVNRIEADSVDADLRGSGDLTIGAGHIGQLAAVLHGSGDLSASAEIGNATVRAGEQSDITLPHVTGRLDRSIANDQDE